MKKRLITGIYFGFCGLLIAGLFNLFLFRKSLESLGELSPGIFGALAAGFFLGFLFSRFFFSGKYQDGVTGGFLIGFLSWPVSGFFIGLWTQGEAFLAGKATWIQLLLHPFNVIVTMSVFGAASFLSEVGYIYLALIQLFAFLFIWLAKNVK